MSELKSPTCASCAKARGLHVPGDIHTIWEGRCENCGEEGPVSPASDWRRLGGVQDKASFRGNGM